MSVLFNFITKTKNIILAVIRISKRELESQKKTHFFLVIYKQYINMTEGLVTVVGIHG